ncbi:MAG: glycosyltransferase family 4 protein, partial [Candidatus Micrarchaeaceae archaeon]
HVVSITGAAPHPQFRTALTSVKRVLRERPLRLPKWVGAYRRKRLLASLDNPHLVFWNRMENSPPHVHATYYEHGAAWMGSVTPEKRAFLAAVDQVIAVSHAAKAMLQLRWGYDRPIFVIPNPRRPDVPIASQPRELSGKLRLGFIGRLIPIKGIPIVVQVLQELKKLGIEAELWVAGTGPDASLLQGVHHTPLVNDVVSWYDSIDILLVPSIREPLGLIAVEAAARGVPVLASAVDGLPEVVSGICVEPTLSLQEYIRMGGQVKNLPEVVYNPVTKSLMQPKILDPSVLARKVQQITENYTYYSHQALCRAGEQPTFDQYVLQLKERL